MVGGSISYNKSLTSSSNRVLLTSPNLTSNLGNVDDPRDDMDVVNLRFLLKSLVQSGSSAYWGSVLGDVNLQTDLINLLNLKENISNKGVNNGYASLNGSGIVPNTQLGTGGISTDFLRKDGTYQTITISELPVVVANYSALPLASSIINKSYIVENSQGTEWLPGSLGGTYYPEGLYFSNGVKWVYQKTSYQATQLEVNTGINTDKFITPNTLLNSTQWNNYQPLDGDLTAIAALNTNGLIRRTGTNTWVIDNTSYLTSIPVTETEINLGTLPTTGKSVNVTVSGLLSANKVQVWLSGNQPTGKGIDELEMDSISVAAKANNGNFTLFVSSNTKIKGNYKIYYTWQ